MANRLRLIRDTKKQLSFLISGCIQIRKGPDKVGIIGLFHPFSPFFFTLLEMLLSYLGKKFLLLLN